jgi:hypothetical protein
MVIRVSERIENLGGDLYAAGLEDEAEAGEGTAQIGPIGAPEAEHDEGNSDASTSGGHAVLPCGHNRERETHTTETACTISVSYVHILGEISSLDKRTNVTQYARVQSPQRERTVRVRWRIPAQCSPSEAISVNTSTQESRRFQLMHITSQTDLHLSGQIT